MKKKKRTRFRKITVNHLYRMKWKLLVAALCMIGFTLSTLMGPWPLKIIFDYVLLDKPFPAFLSFLHNIYMIDKLSLVLTISLAVIVIALFRAIFSYFQVFITSQIGLQLVCTLRKELFAHLQRLSLSFHNRERSGELLTKVTSDTKALKNIFSESIMSFATHLLTLIGMFVIMFSLNIKLSLFVLATFPAMVFSILFIFRKIKVTARKQRKKEGKIASQIGEIMTSVLLIKAFGRESYEDERFETISEESTKESIKTARMEAAAMRSVEIISAIGKWAVIFFGALQVLESRMTPGDILIFSSYVGKMFSPIKKMVKLSTKFTKATISIERLNEILEVEPEINDDKNAIVTNKIRGKVVFNDVSFGYNNTNSVLKNISFAIQPGQHIALVGASGAGKSTIVSLVIRLYDPMEGTIFIDGLDIKKYKRESLRQEIGIVLQDSMLLGTTIRENISYGKIEATREEIEEAAIQAHAHDFIIALPDGYDTIIGERGCTLSGGQRQRISLARTIIKRPSVLILDEPTSAVDTESEMMIKDAINRLQKDKTTIYISHQFSSMEEFDQILALKDGNVVETGKHDQLLDRKGYYSELFHMHNSHYGIDTN